MQYLSSISQIAEQRIESLTPNLANAYFEISLKDVPANTYSSYKVNLNDLCNWIKNQSVEESASDASTKYVPLTGNCTVQNNVIFSGTAKIRSLSATAGEISCSTLKCGTKITTAALSANGVCNLPNATLQTTGISLAKVNVTDQLSANSFKAANSIECISLSCSALTATTSISCFSLTATSDPAYLTAYAAYWS